MTEEKRGFISELEERVGKLHPDSPHSRIFSGIIEGFGEIFKEIQELAENAKNADFSIVDWIKKSEEARADVFFLLKQEIEKIKSETKSSTTTSLDGCCSGNIEDRLSNITSRMTDVNAFLQRMNQLESRMTDVINLSKRIDQLEYKTVTMLRDFKNFTSSEKDRRSDILDALEDLTESFND
jgi:vacuolar-type H+-ATPase subunit I/STV1